MCGSRAEKQEADSLSGLKAAGQSGHVRFMLSPGAGNLDATTDCGTVASVSKMKVPLTLFDGRAGHSWLGTERVELLELGSGSSRTLRAGMAWLGSRFC